MSSPTAPPTQADFVRQIAAWPQVVEHIEAVRKAGTDLRWHQALRRRIPESAAESRVRGARASADLDGARTDDDTVRRLLCGAASFEGSTDPAEAVIRAAVQVTAESEHVRGLLRKAPAQAIARLHVAAGTPLLEAEAVGRPRRAGETAAEFTSIGEAPADPAVVAARLRGVGELLADPALPAFVVSALVHAEIATVRPFVRGNGLVARALERAYAQESGLDPTGVVVPEVGHGAGGLAPYVGALTAYGLGTKDGLLLWLEHCANAMVAGAAEGRRIADAVLAGRLPS